jgi:hypothetical protein
MLIAGFVILVAPGTAPAEVTNFGIKAGVSFANVFSGEIFDRSYRTGFCGGFFLTYEFTPVFSVQPEVLFVMKGSRHREGFGPNALSEVMSLEYMEVPLLARFRLPISKSMDVHLLAGPSPALGVRFRVNSIVGGQPEEESLDNVNGFDIGAVAGAGVDIPVKNGKVCLDFRYTFGLTTISKGAGNGIKNGALCLFLGYAF